MNSQNPAVWLDVKKETTVVRYDGHLEEISGNLSFLQNEERVGKLDEVYEVSSFKGAAKRFEKFAVLNSKEVDGLLSACVNNLVCRLEWKGESLFGEVPTNNNLNTQLLVEFCHLMVGLSRHCALASAECENRKMQENLAKLSIHWDCLAGRWKALVREMFGAELSEFEPLASTVTLQLALEELAAKDTLAYCYIANIFGAPGMENYLERIFQFVQSLINNSDLDDKDRPQEVLRFWKNEGLDNSRSYASVEILKDKGYPFSGSYGLACAEKSEFKLYSDVSMSCKRVRMIDENLSLFFRGVSLFYSERNEVFPRRKINWLSY